MNPEAFPRRKKALKGERRDEQPWRRMPGEKKGKRGRGWRREEMELIPIVGGDGESEEKHQKVKER